MAEYTYADVIIDPDDPRVEIGKEYYFGNNPACLLKDISQLSACEGRLMIVDKGADICAAPFMYGKEYFVCIIHKKESEKEYVPFDLTKEEDRNCLKGKWLKRTDTGDEDLIISFSEDSIFIAPDQYWEADKLLALYVFEDGSPCGKLVEADHA